MNKVCDICGTNKAAIARPGSYWIPDEVLEFMPKLFCQECRHEDWYQYLERTLKKVFN